MSICSRSSKCRVTDSRDLAGKAISAINEKSNEGINSTWLIPRQWRAPRVVVAAAARLFHDWRALRSRVPKGARQ